MNNPMSPGQNLVAPNTGNPTTMVGAGGLIGAAADVGVAIYNSQAAKKQQERNIQANKEMAEYQWQQNIDMWNRQNLYNDPSAQMARFAAAGLNPAMMYGKGSAGAGNAQSLPKYSAANVDHTKVPAMQLPQMGLSAYQNYKMANAQINLVEEQQKLTQQKSMSESLNRSLTNMRKDLTFEEKRRLSAQNLAMQQRVHTEDGLKDLFDAQAYNQYQLDVAKVGQARANASIQAQMDALYKATQYSGIAAKFMPLLKFFVATKK